MSESREEFEKYWIDRCSKKGVECVLVRMIDGEYYNISAFYAYEGWKASRESLVVEFPDLNSQFISTTMKNKIINSIESQGIKVATKQETTGVKK